MTCKKYGHCDCGEDGICCYCKRSFSDIEKDTFFTRLILTIKEKLEKLL